MKNTRIKLNIINIIVFSLAAIIIFSGSRAISKLENNIDMTKISIEEQWREQAQAHIEHTIRAFDNDINSGFVDPHNDESVAEWVRKNYTNIGGIHSNGWVGDIGSGDIIDDQCISRMVIKNSDKDNKKRIISDNFLYDDKNKDQIDKIIKLIMNGKTPKYGDAIQYEIDGTTEWIEFNYYPLLGGLDREYRTIYGKENQTYKRYVFVIGVRSSDIYYKCSEIILNQKCTIILLYIIMFASCFFSIILMSVLFYKYVYTY